MVPIIGRGRGRGQGRQETVELRSPGQNVAAEGPRDPENTVGEYPELPELLQGIELGEGSEQAVPREKAPSPTHSKKARSYDQEMSRRNYYYDDKTESYYRTKPFESVEEMTAPFPPNPFVKPMKRSTNPPPQLKRNYFRPRPKEVVVIRPPPERILCTPDKGEIRLHKCDELAFVRSVETQLDKADISDHMRVDAGTQMDMEPPAPRPTAAAPPRAPSG